jgi:hypothetical protein
MRGWLSNRELTGDDARRWSKEGFGGRRPDRRVKPISDGGVVTRGRLARTRRWVGVGAELGRP